MKRILIYSLIIFLTSSSFIAKAGGGFGGKSPPLIEIPSPEQSLLERMKAIFN